MNTDTLQYIKDRANENETGSIKAVSCADVRELLKERAELIEALKSLAESAEEADKIIDDYRLSDGWNGGYVNPDIEAARAAIAKVEGK